MSEISVLILMGSDSDAPVMQAAVDVLREFEVPCEMTVASAHRSPERVMRLVGEAPGRGVKIFIVGAGAAAHLGGVVAAHTILPVIGVRSEEHTSELQSRLHLVCRLLLEKKKPETVARSPTTNSGTVLVLISLWIKV